MSDDQAENSQKKVLMLTARPQDMEPFLLLMPDVALMPVEDVLHDKSALRERVADSFMASQCDVIIIDSRYPIDLATLCRAIREYPSGNESHVLVMTHSEQDWATCMGLNVDDVVRVKPNEPVMASLATVMARYMRALTQRKLLEEKSRQAQMALETASEYGALLRLMRVVEEQTDLDSLAQLVSSYLSEKSLDSIIQITTLDRWVRCPETGAPSSHYTVLSKLAESDSTTVELDRLLGYRRGVITLLVTNAPHKDPVKYATLKEAITYLCSIVDTKARYMILTQEVGVQTGVMSNLLKSMHAVSKHIHDHLHGVIVGLGQDIEVATSSIDMSVEDESRLLKVASDARDRLEMVDENREDMESHFVEFLSAMQALQTFADTPSG